MLLPDGFHLGVRAIQQRVHPQYVEIRRGDRFPRELQLQEPLVPYEILLLMAMKSLHLSFVLPQRRPGFLSLSPVDVLG